MNKAQIIRGKTILSTNWKHLQLQFESKIIPEKGIVKIGKTQIQIVNEDVKEKE
jgi:hypothetical protein